MTKWQTRISQRLIEIGQFFIDEITNPIPTCRSYERWDKYRALKMEFYELKGVVRRCDAAATSAIWGIEK